MKPQGYMPRATPDAKQRIITVRLPGQVHARLCKQRVVLNRSINDICLDAINLILPAEQADKSQDDVVSTNQTITSASSDDC